MAGLLNSVYLVVTTIVAIVGLAVVLNVMNETDEDGPDWAGVSAIVVAAIFLLALAAGFMT